MVAIDSLIEKIYSMNQLGTNSMANIFQGGAGASTGIGSGGAPYGSTQVLVERYTDVMKYLEGLQVPSLSQPVPTIPTITPGPPPVSIPELVPPSTKYTVRGGLPSIEETIRNIIRRLLGERGKEEPREPELVDFPEPLPKLSEPRLPGEPEKLPSWQSLDDYKRNIMGTVAPLSTPTGPRPPFPIPIPKGADDSELKVDDSNLLPTPRRALEPEQEVEKVKMPDPKLGPPLPVQVPHAVDEVKEMTYNISKIASQVQVHQPNLISPHIVKNLYTTRTQVLDIVSQRVVDVNISPAALGIEPMIAEGVSSLLGGAPPPAMPPSPTIGGIPQQSLVQIRLGMKGLMDAASALTPRTSLDQPLPAPTDAMDFQSQAQMGLSTIADTAGAAAQMIQPVLEREAESKAAQVASEVMKMTEFVAEKGADVYKGTLAAFMATQSPETSKALALVPSLALLASPILVSSVKATEELKTAAMKGGGVSISPVLLKMASKEVASTAQSMQTIQQQTKELEDNLKHQVGTEPLHAYIMMSSAIGQALSATGKGAVEKVAKDMAQVSASIKPETKLLGPRPEPEKALDQAIAAAKPTLASKATAGLAQSAALAQVAAGKTVGASATQVAAKAADTVINKETAAAAGGTPQQGGLPTPKLQNIVPVMQQIAAIQASKPTATERAVVAQPQKPIEVKVEYDLDDMDLKELERKIAKILKDEARRYGIY